MCTFQAACRFPRTRKSERMNNTLRKGRCQLFTRPRACLHDSSPNSLVITGAYRELCPKTVGSSNGSVAKEKNFSSASGYSHKGLCASNVLLSPARARRTLLYICRKPDEHPGHLKRSYVSPCPARTTPRLTVKSSRLWSLLDETPQTDDACYDTRIVCNERTKCSSGGPLHE